MPNNLQTIDKLSNHQPHKGQIIYKILAKQMPNNLQTPIKQNAK